MSDSNKINKQNSKSQIMRQRICDAAVVCLDELGYSEASILRIQTQAGVSRGALTHHFPTKQALITETTERLLASALKPVQTPHQSNDDTFYLLMDAWTKLVNTPEGRALVEVLVACRTDQSLSDTLSDKLQTWDKLSSESFSKSYSGADGSSEDAALLWSICRSFIRGLLLHQRFVSDQQQLMQMMERFAHIMEAHLKPKC